MSLLIGVLVLAPDHVATFVAELGSWSSRRSVRMQHDRAAGTTR
jgi:hypothetical protein